MTQTSDALVVREITTADDAIFNKLVNGERVHPIANAQNLAERRLSPAGGESSYRRHCYGLFAEGAETPSAVVYVSLTDVPEIGGKVKASALPGNIREILKTPNPRLPGGETPNTAIFYSISSFGKPPEGLPHDMGAGEYLIKQVAKQLKGDGIRHFSTLSPLRQQQKGDSFSGFRHWLQEEFGDEERVATRLTHAEQQGIAVMAARAGFTAEGLGPQFLLLAEHIEQLDASDQKHVQAMLKALAADYLISAPSERRTLDGVEKFHLSNGALIGQLHVHLPHETTKREWAHGFGVMVNYLYRPENLDLRRNHFRGQQRVAAEGDIWAAHRTRKALIQLKQEPSWQHRVKALQDPAGRAR